ncbi:MAG: hypothetical protein HDR88_18980 [Bacteroides sp.]|nr:hypothetical protein [Bacteroides sp.]
MTKLYFTLGSLLIGSAMSAQPLGIPKLLAPMETSEVSNEIIYEAPEGETKFYTESYDGWVFWGSQMGLFYLTGNTAYNYMVWTEDSKVYILDPVKTYTTGSYAVGTYADGKITVELPQCIGAYYDEYGEIAYMYLNKMEEVEQDGEKYYMICYPEDNYLVYDVDDEGNVKLNLGNDYNTVDTENGVNPKYLVGMTYENDPHALQVWSGFGDSFENWDIVPNETPITPPTDLVSEYWAFDTNGTAHLLEVKIDGNDIYLNGFTSYIEGYWIKGTLTREKDIVIPSQQYMGKNEYDQFYYFLATKVVPATDPDSWNTYEMIDQITMKYDSETKIYSAPGECFCVSNYRDAISYMALAENPMLWEQTPEMLNAAPENPYLGAYTPFNPETNQGTVNWMIPNTNVNDALLRTDKMYYNFYVDGELFTFEPDEYSLFSEPTTDVPYASSNFYDIFVYNQSHIITFKFSDAESFGLQSFYVADDGTTYASDLITVDLGSVGVEKSELTKEVKEVIFYNLSGAVISNPTNGIYIKRVIYTDGSQSTEKTVISAAR